MGSFIPLGGFFSTASEFVNSCRNKNESTARCKLCNEKYEQEVSTTLRGTTGSVADEHATHLSSWLQKAECGPSKGLVGVEVCHSVSNSFAFHVIIVTLWLTELVTLSKDVLCQFSAGQ